MNPLLQEQVLQFFACNNVTNILGFDKASLRFLPQLLLYLLQNIFVVQDCLPGIGIGMKGELPLSHKIKNPFPSAARAS